MPVPWQKKFVELINQTERLIGKYPEDNLHYEVTLKNDLGRKVKDPLADYERGRRQLPYLITEESEKTFRDILH